MGQRARVGLLGRELESLEERVVLSAGLAAHPVEVASLAPKATPAPAQITLTGQVAGTAGPYYNKSTPVYNTHIAARGTSAQITGPVLVGGFQTSFLSGTGVGTVTNGKAAFQFTGTRVANTYLTVNYTGSGRYNPATHSQTLTFSGTVTGGTGALAGASGTFSGTVTVNDLTDAFTLNYTFKVTP